MLVLSRKINQKLQIGSDIVVTVVRVKGNVIRLGIEAPRDVRILRSELEVTLDDPLTAGVSLVGDGEKMPDRQADGQAEAVAKFDAPAQNKHSGGRPAAKAPLKGFRSTRAASLRDFEDSPMCHRSARIPASSGANETFNTMAG